MFGRRRIPRGFLALVVLVLLSGCVDYPPNPTVCLSCELGIEQAADGRLNVSVDRSELRIRVAEDGSGRWTARSELSGPDVATLRVDSGRVDRLINRSVTASLQHEAIHHPAIHGGDVRNVSGRLVGDTLVISFTVVDMADHGVGDVLLVDYFPTRGETPASYMLGTDRLVIQGPPETVVTNEPSGATELDEGRAIEWRSFETRISGDTYITFGPDHRRSTGIASEVTIALAVFVVVVGLGLPFAAILLGVIALASKRITDRWPIRVGSPGDPIRARLASDPPLDVVAVIFLLFVSSAGIVADFEGFRQIFVQTWDFVALGTFGLLGYSIERSQRLSRSLTVAISGLPFLVASLSVGETSGWPLTGTDSILVATVVFLVIGAPTIYLVYYLGNILRPTK